MLSDVVTALKSAARATTQSLVSTGGIAGADTVPPSPITASSSTREPLDNLARSFSELHLSDSDKPATTFIPAYLPAEALEQVAADARVKPAAAASVQVASTATVAEVSAAANSRPKVETVDKAATIKIGDISSVAGSTSKPDDGDKQATVKVKKVPLALGDQSAMMIRKQAIKKRTLKKDTISPIPTPPPTASTSKVVTGSAPLRPAPPQPAVPTPPPNTPIAAAPTTTSFGQLPKAVYHPGHAPPPGPPPKRPPRPAEPSFPLPQADPSASGSPRQIASLPGRRSISPRPNVVSTVGLALALPPLPSHKSASATVRTQPADAPQPISASEAPPLGPPPKRAVTPRAAQPPHPPSVASFPPLPAAPPNAVAARAPAGQPATTVREPPEATKPDTFGGVPRNQVNTPRPPLPGALSLKKRPTASRAATAAPLPKRTGRHVRPAGLPIPRFFNTSPPPLPSPLPALSIVTSLPQVLSDDPPPQAPVGDGPSPLPSSAGAAGQAPQVGPPPPKASVGDGPAHLAPSAAGVARVAAAGPRPAISDASQAQPVGPPPKTTAVAQAQTAGPSRSGATRSAQACAAAQLPTTSANASAPPVTTLPKRADSPRPALAGPTPRINNLPPGPGQAQQAPPAATVPNAPQVLAPTTTTTTRIRVVILRQPLPAQPVSTAVAPPLAQASTSTPPSAEGSTSTPRPAQASAHHSDTADTDCCQWRFCALARTCSIFRPAHYSLWWHPAGHADQTELSANKANRSLSGLITWSVSLLRIYSTWAGLHQSQLILATGLMDPRAIGVLEAFEWADKVTEKIGQLGTLLRAVDGATAEPFSILVAILQQALVARVVGMIAAMCIEYYDKKGPYCLLMEMMDPTSSDEEALVAFCALDIWLGARQLVNSFLDNGIGKLSKNDAKKWRRLQKMDIPC